MSESNGHNSPETPAPKLDRLARVILAKLRKDPDRLKLFARGPFKQQVRKHFHTVTQLKTQLQVLIDLGYLRLGTRPEAERLDAAINTVYAINLEFCEEHDWGRPPKVVVPPPEPEPEVTESVPLSPRVDNKELSSLLLQTALEVEEPKEGVLFPGRLADLLLRVMHEHYPNVPWSLTRCEVVNRVVCRLEEIKANRLLLADEPSSNGGDNSNGDNNGNGNGHGTQKTLFPKDDRILTQHLSAYAGRTGSQLLNWRDSGLIFEAEDSRSSASGIVVWRPDSFERTDTVLAMQKKGYRSAEIAEMMPAVGGVAKAVIAALRPRSEVAKEAAKKRAKARFESRAATIIEDPAVLRTMRHRNAVMSYVN
jgi:hypothetical protein